MRRFLPLGLLVNTLIACAPAVDPQAAVAPRPIPSSSEVVLTIPDAAPPPKASVTQFSLPPTACMIHATLADDVTAKASADAIGIEGFFLNGTRFGSVREVGVIRDAKFSFPSGAHVGVFAIETSQLTLSGEFPMGKAGRDDAIVYPYAPVVADGWLTFSAVAPAFAQDDSLHVTASLYPWLNPANTALEFERPCSTFAPVRQVAPTERTPTSVRFASQKSIDLHNEAGTLLATMAGWPVDSPVWVIEKKGTRSRIVFKAGQYATAEAWVQPNALRTLTKVPARRPTAMMDMLGTLTPMPPKGAPQRATLQCPSERPLQFGAAPTQVGTLHANQVFHGVRAADGGFRWGSAEGPLLTKADLEGCSVKDEEPPRGVGGLGSMGGVRPPGNGLPATP